MIAGALAAPVLLAAPSPPSEGREASPIALVLIVLLLIAVVLLVRSMNKHLRKLPPSFGDGRAGSVPVGGEHGPAATGGQVRAEQAGAAERSAGDRAGESGASEGPRG